MKKVLSLMAFVLCFVNLSAEVVRTIPYLPDPGISVDGFLKDWQRVPGAMFFNKKEQIQTGLKNYQGKQDLGGKFFMGWREEGLYLAADISDDRFFVNHRRNDNWKSDHLELYLDMTPELDENRLTPGKGQYAVMFLPPVFDLPGSQPQAAAIYPGDLDVKGVRVAAQKTAAGYTIEAFIPVSLFGEKIFLVNRYFRFEAALSDCDTPEAAQEVFMTLSPRPWNRSNRQRLETGVLADASGVGKLPERSVALPEKEFTLLPGTEKILEFEKPSIPEGRRLAVRFRGRLELKNPGKQRCAGYGAKALQIFCNGSILKAEKLTNRPASSIRKNGATWSFMTAAGDITLPFAVDFTSCDAHPSYGLLDTPEAHTFELDITDLVKDGKNRLVFKVPASRANILKGTVFDQVQLKFVMPQIKKARQAAPTGKLPFIAPAEIPQKKVYTCTPNDINHTLNITVNGENLAIQRRFSTPDGKWHSGSNNYFTVERKLSFTNESIIISDKLKNLTASHLPVRLKYFSDFGNRLKQARVGGYEPYKFNGENAHVMNPSSFGATDKAGIALLPWSEAFSVHAVNKAANNTISVEDHNLVIAPNAEHTVETLVIPVPDNNFWSFVNAARRVLKSNYEIKHLYSFIVNNSNPPSKTVKERVDNALGNKKVNFITGHNMWPMYNKSDGTRQYPWGTAWNKVDHSGNKKLMAYIKQRYPNVRRALYFHCYLDPSDNAPKDYAANQILNIDGSPMVYGRFGYMFCPVSGLAYAAELQRIIDMIFDEIDCNAIYWDEFGVSNAKYTYNKTFWDGVSGDISSDGKLLRLKSSVRLLSLPWRKAMIKYIREEKKGEIYTNGSIMPRYAGEYKLQNFVETASISYCLQTILLSPVALGNHLGERNQLDCYKSMLAALDYGCLYAYYNGSIHFAYPTLTEYMFPATPMELHPGYLIARERIVTKKSGIYGWRDNSRHEVHVYDHNGREVKNFTAPQLKKENAVWTELRLPEDYSAVIIRHKTI